MVLVFSFSYSCGTFATWVKSHWSCSFIFNLSFLWLLSRFFSLSLVLSSLFCFFCLYFSFTFFSSSSFLFFSPLLSLFPLPPRFSSYNPVVPTPFVEETILSQFWGLGNLLKDQLNVYEWNYFCALYCVPLTYVCQSLPSTILFFFFFF